MVHERYHQSSNGIGKWNAVKETAMSNLANEVAVECTEGFSVEPSPRVEGTVKGRLVFVDGKAVIVEG